MYIPPLASRILLFMLVLFTACKSDPPAVDSNPAPATGSALFYLEQISETDDSREKLALINRGLKAVKMREDTLISRLLDNKIYYHNLLREYDSSLYYSDSLINSAYVLRDTTKMALGYYRKSKVKFYLNDQEGVFRNAYESRNLYLAIGDSSSAGRRTLEMANAQNGVGDFTGSQESATEALQYLNVQEDSIYISSAYNTIAIAYRQMDFLDDAAAEYKNAMRFSTSSKDSLSYYNNLALVLQENKQYEDATLIFEELLNKVDTAHVKSRARYLDNLAYTQWLRKPASYVEPQFQEALRLRKEQRDYEGLMASYDHLIEYYTGKDQAQANRYSQNLLETSVAYGNSSSELKALKYLITYSPGEASKEYAYRYIALNDSLNNSTLRAKNTFAKIRYDEERKQQEIIDLETLNALQELQAGQLRSQNFIVVLAAVLAIIGLSFLIYFSRQRHKKEKIREVHKTESRISKVIHDELANDIFNVMSSLEPLVPSPVIDTIEKIYLRTRDISRENSEIETGENYLEFLKAILTNNTPREAKLVITGDSSVKWAKLGEEKKIVIYRILQELMINMKKHSGASLVAITFAVTGNKLNIQYFDNGCGKVHNELKKGSGLQNVENRIYSLNGKVLFETEEGKGFKILLQIPL